MKTSIRINPEGRGDSILASMSGTDDDIPMLYVGPVEFTFYDFLLSEAEQAQWLRRLASEASRLAALVDDLAQRKTPVSVNATYDCDRCGAMFGIAGTLVTDEDLAAQESFDADVRYHEDGECERTQVTR